MKKWLVLLFLSGTFTFAASPLSSTVIPTDMLFDNLLSMEQRVEAENLFTIALQIVAQFPPSSLKNHIFSWKEDPTLLLNKSLTITIAPSHSPYAAPGYFKGDLDAFTFTHVDKRKVTMEMFTVLIADKFFQYSGSERFVRLLAALAHELYGNVSRHLGENILDIEPFNDASHRDNEIASFRLSVEFFSNFLRTRKFRQLPGFIRDEFAAQLEREKTALRWWENRGGGGSCIPPFS